MNKKKVIRIIICVCSMVLLGLVLMYAHGLSKGNITYFFGYKLFIITTGSMKPTYPINTLVLIKKTNPQDIQLNEPIAFYNPSLQEFVFHRVVEIHEEGFVTKGDVNVFVDRDIVSFDHLVGRAVFHTTWIVSIINAFENPFILIAISVGFGLMGMCFYKNRMKRKKKNKQED